MGLPLGSQAPRFCLKTGVLSFTSTILPGTPMGCPALLKRPLATLGIGLRTLIGCSIYVKKCVLLLQKDSMLLQQGSVTVMRCLVALINCLSTPTACCLVVSLRKLLVQQFFTVL